MIAVISPAPLGFVGPFELLVLGLVLLVIAFGSRAQQIARNAGKAIENVNATRQEVNKEIDDVRNEIDIDDDIEEFKSEVSDIRDGVRNDMTPQRPPEPESVSETPRSSESESARSSDEFVYDNTASTQSDSPSNN